MNSDESTMPLFRWSWLWAACAGLALALVALFLWTTSGHFGRVVLAWSASAVLGGAGFWLARESGPRLLYAHLLMAGGIGGFIGTICAGHRQYPPGILHSPWLGWLLLACCVGVLASQVEKRRSQWLCANGLVLAWLGITLQQFTVFSLAAYLLLVVVAVWFFRQRQWIIPVWIMLVAIHLGFLLGWPFSDGRVDADRYLELSEYWWTLAFFTAAWAVFTQLALRSPDGTFSRSRRLLFASLNNALFFGVGVLIVPPGHPEWFWKFTLAAGFLLLLAWLLTDRFPRLRRAYAVQGATLIALGLVSAIIGPQPAALLAVASAFFVATVEDRRPWLLRYGAGLTAVLAFTFAWEPVYRSATPSLWLGVFTGAPLVFNSIWISRHRELWHRWAVLFFAALGLGLWLLTTLAQAPAQYHPPILAVYAVIVTGSIIVLGIPEYPFLAASVLLLAHFLWFQQVGNFNSRPWWNPCVVVFCTLALSWWWQTRGRALLPARALQGLQGVFAAVAVAILVLSVESGFGMTATGLILISLLAVAVTYYASALRDWFLFGFGQLMVATAVGEFIGQLTHPPLPGGLAALFPIAALLLVAPALNSPFTRTVWEEPARWVALLYRALAAIMFVVWVYHYIPAANRFLTLAVVALALLRLHVKLWPGGPLLGSVICAIGALLAFWVNWAGARGFRLRDLLAFLLLLWFGQMLRGRKLLAYDLQSIGIVLGLVAVTQWVWNWVSFHHTWVPMAVVLAIVAAIIVCVGWWLEERRYRVFGWVLLLVALGRVLWVDLIESNLPPGTDPAFRFGLLAVGLAALVAAFSYGGRSAPTSKSAVP